MIIFQRKVDLLYGIFGVKIFGGKTWK